MGSGRLWRAARGRVVLGGGDGDGEAFWATVARARGRGWGFIGTGGGVEVPGRRAGRGTATACTGCGGRRQNAGAACGERARATGRPRFWRGREEIARRADWGAAAAAARAEGRRVSWRGAGAGVARRSAATGRAGGGLGAAARAGGDWPRGVGAGQSRPWRGGAAATGLALRAGQATPATWRAAGGRARAARQSRGGETRDRSAKIRKSSGGWVQTGRFLLFLI